MHANQAPEPLWCSPEARQGSILSQDSPRLCVSLSFVLHLGITATSTAWIFTSLPDNRAASALSSSIISLSSSSRLKLCVVGRLNDKVNPAEMALKIKNVRSPRKLLLLRSCSAFFASHFLLLFAVSVSLRGAVAGSNCPASHPQIWGSGVASEAYSALPRR